MAVSSQSEAAVEEAECSWEYWVLTAQKRKSSSEQGREARGRVQTGIAWVDHASASVSAGGMQAASVISNGRLTVASEGKPGLKDSWK